METKNSKLSPKQVTQLPDELLFYILSFLSLKDLHTTSQTNRQFKAIVDNCRGILRGRAKGSTWKEQYSWISNQAQQTSKAIEAFNKQYFKEFLDILYHEEVINDNPYNIAAFLEEHMRWRRINKDAAGWFITHKDYSQVLEAYLEELQFQKLDLTEAMRKFMSNFELPGIGQLGTLMEKFAKAYLKQNPDLAVTNSVAVSNLAFSVYMLCYTEDGVKRQIPPPLKKFVDNNRGINDGKDFPLHFLEAIYDRVIHTGLGAFHPLVPPNTISFWYVVKSGWLNKQGMDLLKMWKRRWFMLGSDNTLYYYKKPTDPLLDAVSLQSLAIAKVFSNKKPGIKFTALSVADKKQPNFREQLYITTDTEEEANSWISAILQHSTGCIYDENPTTERRVQSANEKTKSTPVDDRRPKSTIDKAVTDDDIGIPLPRNVNTLKKSKHRSDPIVAKFLNQYFGAPLERLVEREGELVPLLVQKAVTFLMEKGLDEEGILRLSGSVSEMNNLRTQIESGKIDFTGHDPHAVAGLLKSFIRELPEPLINKDFNDGAAAIMSFGVADSNEVLEELRNIIKSLPKANYFLYRYLLWFLVHVAAHSDKNRMNQANLIRVMIPTLHCIPALLSIPMDNYDYFFSDPEVDSSTSSYPVANGATYDDTQNETENDPQNEDPVEQTEPEAQDNEVQPRVDNTQPESSIPNQPEQPEKPQQEPNSVDQTHKDSVVSTDDAGSHSDTTSTSDQTEPEAKKTKKHKKSKKPREDKEKTDQPEKKEKKEHKDGNDESSETKHQKKEKRKEHSHKKESSSHDHRTRSQRKERESVSINLANLPKLETDDFIIVQTPRTAENGRPIVEVISIVDDVISLSGGPSSNGNLQPPEATRPRKRSKSKKKKKHHKSTSISSPDQVSLPNEQRAEVDQ